MTIRDNKLKDLTPLNVSFVQGESPTAEKLQGMMFQAQVALEYLEAAFGDAFGQDPKYNTWMSTLARDLGDRSQINPSIVPNQVIENYTQNLTIGKVEHELDLTPVGELSGLIFSSLDSSVVPSQWKSTVELLEKPGDWTIASGYIENGKHKRSRKLVTHSPSNGGSIIIAEATSGRGSSTEEASENTIPNIAQAMNGGPFVEIASADPVTNTYLVTLPVRTKMFDKTGQIVNFSASNIASGAALNSQYLLPSSFFGSTGLELELDDPDVGGGKVIPLNLIKLYDWNTKKEVEGIVRIQASPVSEARKYQILLQMKQDVILDLSGSYLLVVPGNTITAQLKGLAEALYNNNGLGLDMTRLISHKNLIGLRTSSSDHTNRSAYYGASKLDGNDHPQYLHRNGFDNSDKGSGANILRGDFLVGNTELGSSDLVHEHFNVLGDSFKIMFGDNLLGGSLYYDKVISHSIDHAVASLPLVWADNALVIKGSTSDADPTKRNVVIDASLRTIGDVVLGSSASDVIFCQGKLYVNDELTLVPRSRVGLTAEEGKFLYDSSEKSLVFYNGINWITPNSQSGYDIIIGNGTTTSGKYNGTNITPFQNAITELVAKGGGIIKVLSGTYNFLTNELSVPANITIEGSGPLTLIKGTNNTIRLTGANAKLKRMTVEGTVTAIVVDAPDCILEDLKVQNSNAPITLTTLATGSRVASTVNIISCQQPILGTPGLVASQSLVASPGYFPAFANGLFDWTKKTEVAKEFDISGSVVLTYNSAGDSAVGSGRFEITGSGSIVTKKFLPVSPKLGFGGHLCITCNTAASAQVGVRMYDKDHLFIGDLYFIKNSALQTGTLSDNFFKGVVCNGVGTTTEDLPSNVRYVKPIINILSNTGSVFWDLLDIQPLSYARSATWG